MLLSIITLIIAIVALAVSAVDQLRDTLRELRPDIIPSKRSENARRQPRNGNGQFVKKEA